MRTHRVSRVTVRQALNLLREQGLIERFARRGSFVASREADSRWVASSIEDLLHFGVETVPRIIEWKPVHSLAAAKQLLCPPGEAVYRLRSIRSHQGVPLYYVEAYTLHRIGRELNPEDLRHALLLELIEKKLGMQILNGAEEISAGVAHGVLARRLRVSPGTPLLILQFTFFGVDGRPLECAKVWFRADQFRRRNQLARHQSMAPGFADTTQVPNQ